MQAPVDGALPIGERVATLDILRGFALLGILIMNMPGFGNSFFVEADGSHLWPGRIDQFAENVRDLLFSGKFNSMFSLLFGICFTIQFARMEQRDPPRHLALPAPTGAAGHAGPYDYMRSQFGRNSHDNTGTRMLSVVERGDSYLNNAWWDGLKVTFSTVTSSRRSLAGSIDVVAHEWGHAVTDYESDLIYQKEPGALNESFSDMLGISVGFGTGIDPDWLMAENSYITGGPMRNLANPHACSQPDTYIDDPYWQNVVGCTPTALQ